MRRITNALTRDHDGSSSTLAQPSRLLGTAAAAAAAAATVSPQGVVERSKTSRNEDAVWRLIGRYFEIDDDDDDYYEDRTLRLVRGMTDERQIAFFRWLADRRYSATYARSIRDLLAKHNDRIVPWSIIRSSIIPTTTMSSVTNTAPSVTNAAPSRVAVGNASLKSDGRLTFTEREYDLMLRRCEREIVSLAGARASSFAIADSLARYRTFLYTFYLLARTGKRLSDVAEITYHQLTQLRDRGVCVIKIRKTGKLGRIEISELLQQSSQAATTTTTTTTNATTNATRDNIRSYLDIFAAWSEEGEISIPFNLRRKRRELDSELDWFYRKVVGGTRPRGLSFHALRRIYAGYKFLQGASIERLRENLDHSCRHQTNRYVNSCLYEITNRRQ